MLACFPEPYPDEVFYSICARYGARMHYTSGRGVVRDLFGPVAASAVVDLPSHLDRLAANLTSISHLSANDYIEQHTLFPYYEAFQTEKCISQLRDDMRGDKGGSMHVRAGLAATRVTQPRWLRFCPLCVKQDRESYGEVFWRRSHQLPGILVCPIHGCDLEDSSAQIRPMVARQNFMAAENHVPPTYSPSYRHSDASSLFFALAQEAQVVLERKSSPLPLCVRQMLIQESLTQKGMLTPQNHVRYRLLAQSFEARYPTAILHELQSELDSSTQNGWLVEILRSRARIQHPIRYLLLLNFLGISVTQKPSPPQSGAPFGVGPWPCRNPACEHYMKAVIDTCAVTQTQERPIRLIGHFKCGCGYIYSQTAPLDAAAKGEPPIRLISFGAVWDRRLVELWHDPTCSLRSIAGSLKVDPTTVKRSALRLGLPFPRKAARVTHQPRTDALQPNISNVLSFEDIRDEHRKKWLQAARQHPHSGRKALRQMLPSSYAWLYRHDRSWLSEQQRVRRVQQPATKQRVNWSERDASCSGAIQVASERLRNKPGRPVYISRAALLNASGVAVTTHRTLRKLPETRSALEKCAESLEQFALRRVRWAAEVCLQSGGRLPRWRVVRLAGVGRLVGNLLVAHALDEAMEQIRGIEP